MSEPLSLDRVLRSESLPTLPAVAVQLLQKTSDPDVSLTEIATLIQSDPGLSSKVLKTVNSSFYGLPSPCPSIDRAIKMLGLRAVKSLVLGFSMLSFDGGGDQDIELESFWKHMVFASAGARQIAKRMNLPEPDEVFAAALFQDMGVLALLAVESQIYGPVFAKSKGVHSKLIKLEQEELGVNHAELGGQLAERWRMPSSIVNAVRYHHATDQSKNDKKVVTAVGLGGLAAAAIVGETEYDAVDAFVSKAMEVLDINADDVPQIFEEIRQASREIARILDQPIGQVPSVDEIMGRAGQLLIQQQVLAERETMQAQARAVEAERMAHTDGLTGVGNRKCFNTLVEQVVNQAYAEGKPVATLFFDADKFKSVNDTYGHHVGDAVLIEFARRLTETLGDRGTVCRYGGEEFAIVLPNTDKAQSMAIGEELRQTIDSRPFDLTHVEDAPTELHRTVSVGVAYWLPGDQKVPPLDLVQRADKALYLAKESGRNNVKTWGVDLDASGNRPADGPIPISLPPEKLSVLVIEDDALASRLMQATLLRTGRAEVTIAADGRTAIETLRDMARPGAELPDIIVCDINMPGFNGIQIIRALKANARFKQIPIHVVTGSEDENELQACREAGATSVEHKVDVGLDMKAWCQRTVGSVTKAA